MLLTFKYRSLTSRKGRLVLEELLETLHLLYNDALWERIECYKRTGRTISYFDQCKSLTECPRDIPEMAAIPVQLQRGTLKRLDGRRLRSKAFGSIRDHLHRKMEVAKKKIINSMGGLDVGLENLATLSTGEHKAGDCLKSAPGNVSLVSK